MSSHQPSDTPRRGRGFRGQSRGRSNHRSTRGRGFNRGQRDSYPSVSVQDEQMEGTNSHQSVAFPSQNPLTNSQAGSSNPNQINTHPNLPNPNYPSAQVPSFTHPLAASINSAIQNVLPTFSSAQLPQTNSNGASNPMFPYNSNSQNHRAAHFQPQGANYFCSTGMAPKNMLGGPTAFAGRQFPPTNLPQPMYMSNPYTPAYNMQMMPNPNYPNGYPTMGHMNYAPSQASVYPQTIYPATQPIPSMNHLSGWPSQWSSMQQPMPRVTTEGYTISNTAIDDQSEPVNKKQRHNGRGNNSERHRCEPCHQDFPSFPALVMHRNGHTKCSEPGCKYEGNAKSVEIHEEDRHLRFKPGKEPQAQSRRPDGPAGATIQGLGYALQTEEQIAKWIEERRKRWPTSKVIAEKAAKGPKASLQGPSHGRGDRTAGRGLPKSARGKAHAGPSSQRKAPNVTPQFSEKVPTTKSSQKRSREDEDDGSGDDEEDEEAVLRERYLKSRSTNGTVDDAGPATVHRNVDQGNDDEDQASNDDNEDMDPIKDAVSSKIEIKDPKLDPTQQPDPNVKNHTSNDQTDQVAQNMNEKQTKVCKWWKLKRCKRGDSCLYSHPPRDQPTKKQKPSKNKPTMNTATQPTSGSGLLSKLLEKDIKQDVADLASVISFLVENDFLDHTELQIGEERLIEPILPIANPTSTLPVQLDLLSTGISSGSEDFDTEDEDESIEDSDSEMEEEESDSVKVEVATPDSTVLDETPVIKAVNHTETIQCTTLAH